MFGAMHPRFLSAGSLSSVVAVNRLKGCKLDPLSQQIRLGGSSETTHISASHSKSAQAEIQQHGCGEPEMVPGAAIVSRPGSGEALPARVCSPGKYKGTRVWRQVQQAFIGGAGIFHSIHVVNLKVACRTFSEPRLLNAVLGLNRHCFRRRKKDRGFIHVVPEARHALRYKLAIEPAPPPARTLLSEIGKDRRARPHIPYIERPIRVFKEMISRHSTLVWPVIDVWAVRYMQVSDGHQSEMLLPKILYHPCKIREFLRVHSKGPIFLLVIDVHVKHVRRNLERPQLGRNLSQLILGLVAIS